MKVELIKIGNSRGIRISKPIIEQCGFGKDVELEISGNSLIVSPSRGRREGWDKAFKVMQKNGDDELLDDDMVESKFDSEEWMW
jgi:antitoxin MazE